MIYSKKEKEIRVAWIDVPIINISRVLIMVYGLGLWFMVYGA
jgi:Na+-transporting NADH:ubiquinone oxidoreductase subunit NqrC